MNPSRSINTIKIFEESWSSSENSKSLRLMTQCFLYGRRKHCLITLIIPSKNWCAHIGNHLKNESLYYAKLYLYIRFTKFGISVPRPSIFFFLFVALGEQSCRPFSTCLKYCYCLSILHYRVAVVSTQSFFVSSRNAVWRDKKQLRRRLPQ